MKFEGPAPETETRHVSLSIAAFIVVASVVLFGIAMAAGSLNTNKPSETLQPETVSEEQASSETMPPPLPAVTMPEVTPVEDDSEAQEEASGQADAQPVMASAPQVAATKIAAAGDTSTTAPTLAAGRAENSDPSFPTRRSSEPAQATTAAQPAQLAAAPKRSY